jgi:hypothetical protein
MKKLLVIALVLAALPLFGQGTGATLGLTIDSNYFMMTPKDDTAASESFFGEVSAAATLSGTLPGDIDGFMKLAAVESMSDGRDVGTNINFEEMWVAKKGAFNQEALSFKFGKQDVLFNMNVDNGITHAFTYGEALVTSGIGAINNTWGFAVGYNVAGVGTFTLTTFEGMGGTDVSGTDPVDEDSGLFTSMALNWNTGADAFGVAGLQLVVGYAMLATDEDADNGSIISLGGMYTIPGVPLVVSLEIDMSTAVTAADQEGAMLMALGADYKINDQFKAGLKYESLAYSKDDAIPMDANSDTRIALFGSYILAENSEIRFEYSDTANSEDDTLGYSVIAIGYKGKI